MRAIAVISVVVFHTFSRVVPGGFVGVDIFFVISGFLISSIINSDLKNNKFSIANFYIRRIRRIFPALITVVLITFMIGWYCLLNNEFIRLGSHIFSSTLFFENFKLIGESGYFDTDSETKPLLHLWSLAIEEQFYIFWPPVLYLAYLGHVRFSNISTFIGLASFGAGLYYVYHDPAAAYFSPFGRFWELMVGAALAHLNARNLNYFSAKPHQTSLIGLLLIIFSLFHLNRDSLFPGYWALLPTLGAALLIAAGPRGWVNQKLLSNRLLVWFGLISYPLYLWHWPLLSYSHIIFGLAPRRTYIIIKSLIVVVSVGLSFLTFRFIEAPFRARGGTPVKLGILTGSMVTVLAIGASMSVHQLQPRLSTVASTGETEWNFLKTTTDKFDPNGNGVYEFHPERDRVTLFIGDSQVAQYAEHVARYVQSSVLRGAIFAIGAGCVPIERVIAADIRRQGCRDILAQGFDLARRENVTTVVIGGSWNAYFLNPGYALIDGPSLSTSAGKVLALRKLQVEIALLSSQGKRVFLLLGNPISPYFDPITPSVRLGDAKTYEKNRMSDVPVEQFDLRDELLALAEHTGASAIDPFLALSCNGRQCRSTDGDGLAIFKDAQHFNPAWAMTGTSFIDVALADWAGRPTGAGR